MDEQTEAQQQANPTTYPPLGQVFTQSNTEATAPAAAPAPWPFPESPEPEPAEVTDLQFVLEAFHVDNVPGLVVDGQLDREALRELLHTRGHMIAARLR